MMHAILAYAPIKIEYPVLHAKGMSTLCFYIFSYQRELWRIINLPTCKSLCVYTYIYTFKCLEAKYQVEIERRTHLWLAAVMTLRQNLVIYKENLNSIDMASSKILSELTVVMFLMSTLCLKPCSAIKYKHPPHPHDIFRLCIPVIQSIYI